MKTCDPLDIETWRFSEFSKFQYKGKAQLQHIIMMDCTKQEYLKDPDLCVHKQAEHNWEKDDPENGVASLKKGGRK